MESDGLPRRRKKRKSQSANRRERLQKARAAEPPLLAMMANVDPTIIGDTNQHLRVLRNTISIGKLSEEHPIRRAWTSPTSLARFQLHHLADDLLSLKGVPGLDGLVKAMVRSADTYEDFRFELRTAANIARSGESSVVSLAGSRPGPDIELLSTNAKRCGIACYRARGEAVPVEEVDARCFDVMTEFAKAFYSFQVGFDVGLEVLFPAFPPTTDDWVEATTLLARLWRTANPPELDGDRGVRVRRCIKMSSLAHLGIRRRARVRFLFRVGERERFRSMRHIQQKLTKEDWWARSYCGVPLFAYQASPWDSLPGVADLAGLVDGRNLEIKGVVATEISYPASDGAVHSFEDLHAYAPGLHLSFCTFGQNASTWAGDSPAVGFSPEYASSYWDAQEQMGVVLVAPSKPLGVVRKRRRLAEFVVNDIKKMDRTVIQALAESAIEMRDEDSPFEW